jgi:hypothetical protein
MDCPLFLSLFLVHRFYREEKGGEEMGCAAAI